MTFRNVYADAERAASYAMLEFPGTYYLAYRDLPRLLCEHVRGNTALDFGCGTGRSTRFLARHGFEVVGVDIATDMIRHARHLDPHGDYRLIGGSDPLPFREQSFDLIFSIFTFDNVSDMGEKIRLFGELKRLLKHSGRLLNLVSSPAVYTHEWASFSTREFPENSDAKNGEKVHIVMKDVADHRPVEDILCDNAAYCEIYKTAGLTLCDVHTPLGVPEEPFDWVSETRLSPWVISILRSV